MDNICFLVSIRYRICQSGVPVVSEKTYTNISSDSNILLYNGYTLSLSRGPNDSINLIFNNTALNLNFTFTVNNQSTNIFDLPMDGGTFRIAIFALMRCCTETGGCHG